MVLCLARLWGIPQIDHAQPLAAFETSFQAACLRRVQAPKSALSSFASCSVLLAFQLQKPNALDEFEQEKGRSTITEDLFQSLITDLSAEGFFTFNETTNTLHP